MLDRPIVIVGHVSERRSSRMGCRSKESCVMDFNVTMTSESVSHRSAGTIGSLHRYDLPSRSFSGMGRTQLEAIVLGKVPLKPTERAMV